MSIRNIIAVLVVLVIGIFVAANWTAVTTPTSLSLLVATIQAPLGVVMLGVTVFVAFLFLVYAFYLQSSAAREARRLTRDIEAQRELADRAEASRLADLRTSLEGRLDRVSGACSALQQSLGTMALQLRYLEDRSRADESGAPPPPA